MVKSLNMATEARLFNNMTSNASQIKAQLKNIEHLGLSQIERLMYDISTKIDTSNPASMKMLQVVMNELSAGKRLNEIPMIKDLFATNSAVIKEVPEGIAVMAEGWDRPVVFPKDGGFKWLGWADRPADLTTNELWTSAYGEQPALIMGAVGNSNIKPEQVRGGTALTKKELSGKYEQAIVDFYNPIIHYLKENGARAEDIGFAFAHSDCGVDKAARAVIEQNNLRGFATTPTEYTQYLRGSEMPRKGGFPNGYVLADCPFPTVLTRNTAQIDDYAQVYGKMVGRDNPLGVFGGGQHAYTRDAQRAYFAEEGAQTIPVDIMKDKFGIEIPAVASDGKTVLNASRDILERVNGNPYEQYRYAFRNYLPNSPTKQDLAQYDPQAAMATIAYTNLKKAGKIG